MVTVSDPGSLMTNKLVEGWPTGKRERNKDSRTRKTLKCVLSVGAGNIPLIKGKGSYQKEKKETDKK